jgi:hypothetical protein
LAGGGIVRFFVRRREPSTLIATAATRQATPTAPMTHTQTGSKLDSIAVMSGAQP